MEAGDDFGVFELGMNQPGEIAPLAGLLRPLCGLITSIGEAHIEAFGNLEGIAREKAEILRALPPEGLAILDIDSPWTPLFEGVTPCRIIRCSLRAKADYVGQPLDGGQDRMRVEDLRHGIGFDLTLPLPGSHMMRNVLLSVAVAREFGLSPREITDGLLGFTACPMRWERSVVAGFHVINDAYNANPLSMRGAIKTFAALTEPKEKWVVLGGMAELGDLEASAHRDLGDYLARQAWTGVVCVGPRARGIAQGFRELEGKADVLAEVADPAEAARLLREHARPGAGILLKASRADRLERVLSFITPPASGETR
jgi:UDP-N-acetylmuramoyl-tripeptide--D-alanyl-D-alanine ligase